MIKFKPQVHEGRICYSHDLIDLRALGGRRQFLSISKNLKVSEPRVIDRILLKKIKSTYQIITSPLILNHFKLDLISHINRTLRTEISKITPRNSRLVPPSVSSIFFHINSYTFCLLESVLLAFPQNNFSEIY